MHLSTKQRAPKITLHTNLLPVGPTHMINLAATPFAAVEVLIADTNRMQAQLLTSALRRRPEFSISTCLLDSVIDAIAAKPARVALVSLNHSVDPTEQIGHLCRLHLIASELAELD